MELKAEVQAGFDAIDKKVGEALAKHDAEVLEMGKASKATSDNLKALTSDHKSMHDQLIAMGDQITDLAQKGTESKEVQASQGIGSLFVASDAFADFKNGNTGRARATFENNTIVTGGDNSVTRHDQLAGVVPGAFRQLTVMPTVSQGQTSSNIVYYSRELAWTNNAAGTAEGATKPESDLTFEEVTTPIRTIPHFIKVSKQALDDSTFLSSYIDRRMAHGVNNKVEQQIISGDGTGQNYSGWLDAGNFVEVDPAGTTDIYGLANKMKYAVIGADYQPDYFYINPADWSTAETIRRAAGDAAFVAASGAVTYVNNGLTPLLWGLPVVLSNNVPAGSIICKSFDADMHLNRMNTVVEMFEQDGDNVQTNLVTVRAEMRGAEAVMVPAAITRGLISGIT
jgi:HK97 family phage major capsid protein